MHEDAVTGKRCGMKPVYIVLTRTNTILSRLIYAVTKNKYTHASLSLDTDFRCLYSFGRKNPKLLLPAGFVKESIYEGVFGAFENIHCAVYKVDVSDENHAKLCDLLNTMELKGHTYRFNILGLPLCLIGFKKKRDVHFFCSQFVAYALAESGALDMGKDCSLVRPIDFHKSPDIEQIFAGNIGQLRQLVEGMGLNGV